MRLEMATVADPTQHGQGCWCELSGRGGHLRVEEVAQAREACADGQPVHQFDLVRVGVRRWRPGPFRFRLDLHQVVRADAELERDPGQVGVDSERPRLDADLPSLSPSDPDGELCRRELEPLPELADLDAA